MTGEGLSERKAREGGGKVRSRLRLKGSGRSIREFDTVFQSHSDSQALAGRDELAHLLEEVRAACRAQRCKTVEVLYRRALTIDEGFAEAWYGVGLLSLQGGNLDEAYSCLSEFAALTVDQERAEQVEAALFFLERLAGGGEELPPDLQEELEEQFLAAFSDRGWMDEPLAALEGLSPREAARTRKGKAKVLALMREMEWFWDAVVRMVLKNDSLQEEEESNA